MEYKELDVFELQNNAKNSNLSRSDSSHKPDFFLQLKKLYSQNFSEFNYIECNNYNIVKDNQIQLRLLFGSGKCILIIDNSLKKYKFEWIFETNTLFFNAQESNDKQLAMFKKYFKRVFTLLQKEKIKFFGNNKE